MGISNLRTRVLVTVRDHLSHNPDCVDGLWDAKSGDDMLFFSCMSLPSMKKYLSRTAYWVRYCPAVSYGLALYQSYHIETGLEVRDR